MAISIDFSTKIITVPKADTTFVETSGTGLEVRSLDLDTFRQTLNDLQDNEIGITYDTTHVHVAPITVGGTTLARVVELINGYTVTFEDGQYAVNLIGANSNIADFTNVNQVSIRAANSAGLIEVSTTGGGGDSTWTETEKNEIIADVDSIVALLPTDGNNIASDQQVADASGTWSESEKNSLIANVATILSDVALINNGWTDSEKVQAIADITQIIAQLPASNATIAAADDIGNASPWSSSEKDSIISEVDTAKRQATIAANNTEKPL